MYKGYQVIDVNRHVLEPSTLWNDRLPEEYRELVQVRGPDIIVRGRPVTQAPNPMSLMQDPAFTAAYGLDVEAGSSPEYHLDAMDATGVDVGIVHPTLGMYVAAAPHISSRLATALCVVYNDWLHEWCAADSRRLKGLAILPMQDPVAAAAELRRAVTELGMVGAVIRPNLFLGREPHHSDYDVLYSEADALGVPLVVTQLRGSVLPEISADRFDDAFGREACTPAFEMMLAFLSFMGHNVMERFPNLSVGFVGAGAGWLGWWLDRVDEHWGGTFGIDSPSTQPPAYLFKTRGFGALDPWETSAADVVRETGIRPLVWGSHFPHPESMSYRTAGPDSVVDDEQLSVEQKQAILSGNAADLFGLALDELTSVSPSAVV